ncbi:hypothetical protein L1987_48645 [Smallanthus sonchifolius]|uniref:Uncharacterized protein n=1 Tax=Smallanthus sonchifolius TaxID=185202 RepID=A0ACB9FU72_9ASTR|nr:hypothetical protein L1987_48645 [Smallanthus sonchifolius]
MNYLVKNDLVFGVPKMKFSVPDDCIPCKKGKQHKKSHKSKTKNSIVTPLEILHMDLFGPIRIRSIGVKRYNKTCYELLNNRKPNLEYLLPFGNPCTLLKVRDVPTKFSAKAIEGIFLGYVANSTTKRVYNKETCQVEEWFHIDCSNRSLPLMAIGPDWAFDYENLFKSFHLPSDISPAEAAVLYDSYPNAASCSGTQESDSEDENVILQDSSTDPLIVDEPSNLSQGQGEIPTNLDSRIPANQDLSYQSDTIQVDVLPVPEVASIKELKAHPISNNIGDLRDGVQTRSTLDNTCLYTGFKETSVFDLCSHSCFISQVEPKNVEMALSDNNWIEAMQEELAQFDKLKVWNLVDLPKGVYLIGTKWVFKCKKDDRGVMVSNKSRLVVQGFNQQEGIDYTEVYAPAAWLEAISAFLYGKVKEEVYVCQPPGFEDPINPSKVFKHDKALYGLHQAPRAWYETLSTHLMENDFVRGHIDSTLFIKKAGGEYLLVQIYVDDIIFGSTNEGLCKEFESIMKSKFEMSAMGELSFFLGLQVNQKEDGFFIHQSKYVKDILSRFKMEDCTPYDTPIPVNHKLNSDPDGKEVDCQLYREMIGSLMYLTASRPYIMFAVCICSRFQAKPKESRLIAVKRIFRYLKGKQRLGLWFPHGSNFEFNAYTDSDFGGCCLDRKSTTGGCQFLILWIQQQLRDYGLNFKGTPMFIDYNATMSITNNPVNHSKTKHIEIRYHFIRDCADKKLIELVKVHTDDNFADLFTKAFDRTRFEFLIKMIDNSWILLPESIDSHHKANSLESFDSESF